LQIMNLALNNFHPKDKSTEEAQRMMKIRLQEEDPRLYKGILLVFEGAAALQSFKNRADSHDLNVAIDRLRSAMGHFKGDNQHYMLALNALANALLCRYDQSGDFDVLVDLIGQLREALAGRSMDSLSRADALANLAIALTKEWNQTGDTAALVDAISFQRQVLRLQPQDRVALSNSLGNFAATLQLQIGLAHTPEAKTIAELIKLHEEALELCTPGSPERIACLNNLASALCIQYQVLPTPDVFTVLACEERLKEALGILSADHPDRINVLFTLAKVRLTEFARVGGGKALLGALDSLKEGLNLCPKGYPERSLFQHVIARIKLYDSPQFDWQEGLCWLSGAISEDVGALPRKRLSWSAESFSHIEAATTRNPREFLDSRQVLDLYMATISLLPHAAHLGLEVHSRLQELKGSERLCHQAAMRSVFQGNDPSQAIEILEEGKSVFWMQALRLRSPEIEALPEDDRELLRGLFAVLERDSYGLNEPTSRAEFEQKVEQRRQLNQKVNELVDKIRLRPGHERFLKVPEFKHLSQAAEGRLVALLIPGDPVYFAVLIDGRAQKVETGVIALDPSLTTESLRAMGHHVIGSGLRGDTNHSANDVIDSCELALRPVGISRVPSREPTPLRDIWIKIVKPVIEAFELTVSAISYR
jgi:hypothetical protein